MSKSIPKRPNLEFDRRQAKALLRAVTAGNPEAAARLQQYHPRHLLPKPKLADAQLVIAREYGFPSWPAWKAFVETRSLSRKQQAEIALRAICSNDIARARVLLEAEPDLAQADGYMACACGEAKLVAKYVARDPQWIHRPGGINDWKPIEYACFSRWLRCDPRRAEGIRTVVELLLEAGADPNASHPASMDEAGRETVLFAASGIANRAEMTRLLLEAGADVNDGLPEPHPMNPELSPWGSEVLYHTTEFKDTACLKLLLEAKPFPLTVSYCMGRALDHENPEAVRLFLAHSADPNFRTPWIENRTHLHRAVLNGRSEEIVAALLDAGANIAARDATGATAYQYAVRYGKEPLAHLLESRGAQGATEEDRELGLVIAGRGFVKLTKPILSEVLCAAVQANDIEVIAHLIRAGAVIDASDTGLHGTPPLHWAAWRGQLQAVQMLVEAGAAIHRKNAYGGDALGTTIHGSANCFDINGGPAMRLPEEAISGDYPQIVEYLVAAGAKLPQKIWGGSAAVQEQLRRHGVPDEE